MTKIHKDTGNDWGLFCYIVEDRLFVCPDEMFQIAENYIVAKYPMVLCMEDDILYQC